MEEKITQMYMDMGFNLDSNELSLKEQKNINHFLKLEECLGVTLKKQLSQQKQEFDIPDEIILSMAEDFVFGNFLTLQKEHAEEWKKIISNEELFVYFQDIISFISVANSENFKMPHSLKKIIQNRLVSTRDPKEKKQNILIQLKDSLKLIGSDIEGFYEIPVLQEAIPTRSTNPSRLDYIPDGILQFYTKINKQRMLLFQVMKDSPQTINLSMNLSQPEKDSVSFTLKKGNRLVQSDSSSNGKFYFHGLHFGKYELKMQGKTDELYKEMDLDILE